MIMNAFPVEYYHRFKGKLRLFKVNYSSSYHILKADRKLNYKEVMMNNSTDIHLNISLSFL